METEIFFYKFFGCPYINGACYLHRPRYYTAVGAQPEGGMCRMGSCGSLARVSPALVFKRDAAVIARTAARLSVRLFRGGAPRLLNAAAFFDYCLAGVACIKYGTRTDDTATKVANLEKIRMAMDLFGKLAGRFSPAAARRRFVEAAGG